MHATRLFLRTPSSFDFWHTVYSHGWCALPPFSFDADKRTLGRILRLSNGTLVSCRLEGRTGGVAVKAESRLRLSAPQRAEVLKQLRVCLRLDEDFEPFYRAASDVPEFAWVAPLRAGRLLRAPTVFEDVVKMICTTNCSWELTTVMVTNLLKVAGEELSDGVFAFPTPERVAALSERTMRTRVKAGYRAPYLLEFARGVRSGKVDVESWRSSPLETPDLFQRMQLVKGVGPYAAGNLLKLVGRYDELALDSWVRKKFAELHARGRKVKDRTIERHYAALGPWRGLFFWMEMTRDWHMEKFRL